MFAVCIVRRKQDLRYFKLIQKVENRRISELMKKAKTDRFSLEAKSKQDLTVCLLHSLHKLEICVCVCVCVHVTT